MRVNKAIRRFASSLPVVDVSAFQKDPNGVSRDHIQQADALKNAFTNQGFALLEGHGMTTEAMDEVIDATRTFFNQSDDYKQQYNMKGYRGYQRVGVNITKHRKDAHEGIDYYKEAPETVTGVLSTHTNQWPDTPANFRPAIETYINHLMVTGDAVMAAISRGLDVHPDVIKKWMKDPFWILRAISYPPASKREVGGDWGEGCGEHTDYGFLTFLLTDGTDNALEVQTLDGHWLPVCDIPKGTFIINIGDMLSHLTGGLYRATPHRVKSTALQRVSVPFFFEPSWDAVITPLPGIAVSSHAQETFSGGRHYGDHLTSKVLSNFRLENL
eukprot:TRINITY_DN2909_c0_g1_i6.p1 TRINITY_DN2909_c0_g1~~TRINITY_DN2909_c0_g1_i6.p1  ORF type:complete len:347 (+),score=101.00 TRINITY_DN2909_c0_g1_i6:60-1043(+)